MSVLCSGHDQERRCRFGIHGWRVQYKNCVTSDNGGACSITLASKACVILCAQGFFSLPDLERREVRVDGWKGFGPPVGCAVCTTCVLWEELHGRSIMLLGCCERGPADRVAGAKPNRIPRHGPSVAGCGAWVFVRIGVGKWWVVIVKQSMALGGAEKGSLHSFFFLNHLLAPASGELCT
jgi:hypothetical protein